MYDQLSTKSANQCNCRITDDINTVTDEHRVKASPSNGTLESRVKATLEILSQFDQFHSENGMQSEAED
jgi:hypothetical protein